MSDTDATQARQDVVADVDEILEHTINANMLSMPYDVYSELFDAVAGLWAEIENLQAENAKLREQIHWLKQGDILHVLTDQEYIDQCERERLMQVSIDAIDKENDKLRELVRDMHKALFSLNLDYCQACPREDTCVFIHECAFERDMRELGVEA